MPDLNLVQNHFKKLRKDLSDKNSIEEVKKFYDDNMFYEDINREEMFCFGGEFGDGSEEMHFHMGYASLNLMQRIEQLGELHLDGTYRIIICAFPVIVLGLRDILKYIF